MSKVLHCDFRSRRVRRAGPSSCSIKEATIASPPSSARRSSRLADLTWWRPLALLPVLVLLWVGNDGPLAGRQLQMMPGGTERVDARFGKCGEGGPYCVVDGDTIRIGERRIRLVGFDTPEKNSRCQAERVGAERATQALQGWLNRGPFVMSVNAVRATDRYGRELQVISRDAGSGSSEALSGYMVGNDFARDYGGGRRAGWC